MVKKLHLRENNDVTGSNKIDIMGLPTSERIDLLLDLWDSGKAERWSMLDYMNYWEDNGFDTSNYSNTEFNRIWDLAAEYGPEEEEPTYEDGINSREDAYKWLQDKLSEYRNTYYFPPAERNMLDTLIDRFGNTYFWHK